MLWQRRLYLTNIPEALPLVLASVPTWGFGFLEGIYTLIDIWAPLSPAQAIQLLLPMYVLDFNVPLQQNLLCV